MFVFDAARTLVYRGAIDDQYGLGYDRPGPRTRYLADAVEATLAGEAPPVAATSAPGCALDFAGEGAGGAPAAPITWNDQVSRLVQRRCQECHRPGEAAPFSLLRYEQAKDHIAMIKKVVRRGTMPPWFADPGAGELEAKHPAHPAPTNSPTTAPADPDPSAAGYPPIHWANDRSLSAREKADLLAWCDAGAPEGDPADGPLPRQWAQGWTIGKPDAVYEPAAPVSVPAKGPIPYRYVVVNYPVRAAYIFQSPARLLSFNPHSHLRGKAFRYELIYPDGTTRLVLDVPRYDFNWQLEYQLREPIDVPEGARLRVTAWYDNSAANPANPDQSATVRFGEQTTDEMMIGYFTGYRLP